MTVKKRYPRTILATACIPWNEAYEFDEKTFRRLVGKLVEENVRHIYVFGTAGEGYAVTEEQYEHIVEVFADEMNKPGLYPMVCLISLSLQTMLQRIRKAYSLGIRDFQFALPCWGALNDNELLAFFHALCDPFPDCRFLHYNLARARRVLSADDYRLLENELPNLVGAKITSSDFFNIHSLLSAPSELQFFLTDMGFGYGNLTGECGLLISMASTNFKRAWEYFDAAVDRNYEKTVMFIREIYEMTDALIRFTGDEKIDGAYDKIFCKASDSSFPLRLLPPYTANSDEVYEKYVGFLRDHYPQWLE